MRKVLPTIRASGFTFNLSAACAVMRTIAAAPSSNLLELATVTVPEEKNNVIVSTNVAMFKNRSIVLY